MFYSRHAENLNIVISEILFSTLESIRENPRLTAISPLHKKNSHENEILSQRGVRLKLLLHPTPF